MIYLFFLVFIVSDKDARMRMINKLIWSLYRLDLGIWPTKDEWGNDLKPGDPDYTDLAGTDLADGWFMPMWKIIGDIEHMFKVFRMPHQNCKEPCGLCKANSIDGDGGMPWTDCRVPHCAWLKIDLDQSKMVERNEK